MPQPSQSQTRFASRRTARRWMLYAAVLWSAPSALHADPKADYASLFGEDEKKVLATSQTRDDAAFAAKLLARANDLKDAPALQRMVLERAVELAQKDADGIPTAVEAAKQIIATAQGAEKLDWRGRLVDLYAAQYRKATGEKRVEAGNFLLNILQQEADDLSSEHKYADAVKRLNEGRDIARSIRSPRTEDFIAAAKAMQDKQQTAQKYDRLRERLNTQGGDVALLEQVILGYLLELDDPETAKKLAAGHPDKTWERAMELSLAPIDKLSESDTLELGKWYRKAADKATDAVAKVAALERAVGCFDEFLARHVKQDAERLSASRLQEESAKLLLRLPGNTTAKVVIWNQRNAQDKDRGTTTINLALYRGGQVYWRRDNIKLAWSPNEDLATTVMVPNLAPEKVRIEVTGWISNGGGLAEVQVLRNGKNIAAGATVNASGYLLGVTGPATLTDGNTSSAVHTKGYWLLPNKTPGWAEIELTRGPK